MDRFPGPPCSYGVVGRASVVCCPVLIPAAKFGLAHCQNRWLNLIPLPLVDAGPVTLIDLQRSR